MNLFCGVKNNIWKLSGYLATHARIYIAIISIYYLTVPDVHIQQVGLVFLIANIASFLFEVPAGYFADKVGYKKTLVLSKILLLLSTIVLISANNFALLVASGVIASIAKALSSGTISAFMMDTLKEIKIGDKYSKIMGSANAYALMISLVFSAFVPLLVKFDMLMPFYIALVLDIVGLILAASLKNIIISKKHTKKAQKDNFSDVWKFAKSINFLPIAMLTGFLFGCVNGLQVYRGPYQEFTGADVAMFGIYFAAGRLIASLIMLKGDYIKTKFKDIYEFEKFHIYCFSVLLLLLALTNDINVIILIFIIINAMMWSLSQVRNHFYLDMIEGTNFKATLLSIKDQYMQFSNAITTAGLGYLVSIFSYKTGLIIFALYFLIVSAMLYFKSTNKKIKTGLVYGSKTSY